MQKAMKTAKLEDSYPRIYHVTEYLIVQARHRERGKLCQGTFGGEPRVMMYDVYL